MEKYQKYFQLIHQFGKQEIENYRYGTVIERVLFRLATDHGLSQTLTGYVNFINHITTNGCLDLNCSIEIHKELVRRNLFIRNKLLAMADMIQYLQSTYLHAPSS